MPLTPVDYRKTANIHRKGLAADRPAAADVLPGTLYFSTDTNIVERSTGSTWEAYSGTGNGNVTAGGTLTANRLVLGNGGVDLTVVGSLGSATTVLHGNAGGAPSFGAVDLTADVSGDLPFANLTQGAALSVLGVTGNATADVSSIAAGTDHQVLRRSGTALAFGAVNLSQAAAITGDLPVTALSNGTHTIVSSTATGTQNDWAPGLDGNTFIFWSGASDLTVSGLAGGVAGQVVVIKNVSTDKVIFFPHQDTGSSASNRLVNWITGGSTPITPTGVAMFQYETTNNRWQLLHHVQGKAITPTFAAGDFTGSGSMTWTVASGDVRIDSYVIQGRFVSYQYYYATTTVGGTPSTDLRRALPTLLIPAQSDAVVQWSRNLDNGTGNDGFAYVGSSFGNFLFLRRDKTSGNWAASTDNTYVQGFLTWELT